MFSNTGATAATGLIIYVIFALLGVVILYYVIRTAIINALYRHQLWLEEYRRTSTLVLFAKIRRRIPRPDYSVGVGVGVGLFVNAGSPGVIPKKSGSVGDSCPGR